MKRAPGRREAPAINTPKFLKIGGNPKLKFQNFGGTPNFYSEKWEFVGGNTGIDNNKSLAATGQVLTHYFGKQVFGVRVGSNPPRVMVRLGGL